MSTGRDGVGCFGLAPLSSGQYQNLDCFWTCIQVQGCTLARTLDSTLALVSTAVHGLFRWWKVCVGGCVVGNLEKRLEGVCYMEYICPSICLYFHAFMDTCQSERAEFWERQVIPDHAPSYTQPSVSSTL